MTEQQWLRHIRLVAHAMAWYERVSWAVAIAGAVYFVVFRSELALFFQGVIILGLIFALVLRLTRN